MKYFLTCAPTYNPTFKISYYPIWCLLFRLLNARNINITLHKVKAHTDDHYNNKVDQLAKMICPSTTFIPSTLGYNYTLNYNDHVILTPPRLFIKDLLNSINF